MKTNLLDIVQRILSSMDSDEVNSIRDTVESMQVANVVREAYESLLVQSNLPEHYKAFQLQPSTDGDLPNLMTIPEGLDNVLWVKYNKISTDDEDPVWGEVKWLEPDAFLEMTLNLSPSEDNVEVATIDGIDYYYLNDKAPEFYTSLDDRTLIFDSLDLTVDSTLQASKSLAYGLSFPRFYFEDTFVPDLDAQQFPLLINEAKALAFAELKQTVHAKAEKNARRQWISLQHNKKDGKRNTPYRDTLANYGRK